jgi:membrane associated rhomboid family serine protease
MNDLKRWLRRLKSLRHPTVLTIIAANVVVFIIQQSSGSDMPLVYRYGAVPVWVRDAWQTLWTPEGPRAYAPLFSLFTATFLHADPEHLGMNMLLLWIFGSIDEELVGKFFLILCYVFSGIVGNISQTHLSPWSEVPIIGASGAISGMEGLYLCLAMRWNPPWPHVWPMSRPIPPFNLAVVGVLGFLLDSMAIYGADQAIAYGAHIGGFIAGIAFGMLLTTFARKRV